MKAGKDEHAEGFLVDLSKPCRAPAASDCSQLSLNLISLVPLDPATHAPLIYEATHGAKELEDLMWTYLPYGPFPSLEAFKELLSTRLAASKTRISFAVIEKSTRVPVGFVSLHSINLEHRTLDVGELVLVPRMLPPALV